jgi:hypothetical protein
MDRVTAERLLSGGPCHAAGTEPLVRLLAAAAAPARPHELAGEDAAVAAFRQRPASARKPGRRAMLAKLLTVKVTAAFAATAVGGVAVAAAAGGLPDLGGRSWISARPGPVPDRSPATRPAPQRAGGAAASPSARPELVELCKKLASRKDPEKVVDTPPFAPLLTAAGGKDRVAPYCDQLLRVPGVGDTAPPGVSPTPAPAGKPDKPDKTRSTPPENGRTRKSHPPGPRDPEVDNPDAGEGSR